MQKDIALSQSDLLQQWSDQWERESVGEATPGAHEVGFLLGRAARLIGRIAKGEPITTLAEDELPPPQRQDELRDG